MFYFKSKKTLLIGSFLVSSFMNSSAQNFSADRVQPYKENPRYWQYKGEPVLFIGASDEDNPFQWPRKKLVEQLDAMVAAGGNQLRNTMSDRDPGNLRAFAEVEPGKYDLTQWNPEYWQRFETLLEETNKRGVLVQIEVWDRFDHSRGQWLDDPYNPGNNVNYTYAESGFEPEYPQHPSANQQPFFYTVPTLEDNSVVRKFQEAFVRKMLEHSLRYDNVIYCMNNETSGAEEWGAYWAEFIRSFAAEAGREVELTEMWNEWRVWHPVHWRTIKRPDRYDYIDLSQNGQMKGRDHWENTRPAYMMIADDPRPINITKIYGSDPHAAKYEEGLAPNEYDALASFWKGLLGGFATGRFHRPDHGLGLSEPSMRMLRAAREWQKHFDVFRAQPDNLFERIAWPGSNESYLSFIPGEAWSVFTPKGGRTALLIDQQPVDVIWANLDTGEWFEPEPGEFRDGRLWLEKPEGEMWLAVVKAR